jgi:hypothetical protein
MQKMKRTEWKCRFEDIPPDCYEDVLVWDCTENGLTSLPPEIGRLTNLQVLICSVNQLTSLPPEIGHLTNLRVLSCLWNQLTSLPPEIGRLTNLRELYCWGNHLSSKTMEAVKKILVRNKEGDPRDVLVLNLLHTFLGNTFPFQLCDQIRLHCRVQWFCDDMDSS